MAGTNTKRISRSTAVAALIALGSFVWTASAFAGSPPSIESEAVTNIKATDATLEFRINGEGLPAGWSVYLEAPSCLSINPGSCESTGGEQIWEGGVGPSSDTLTMDIAKVWGVLLPDTSYRYHIVASSEAGETVGIQQEFHTEAGPAPSIVEASVTNISASDATLNMKIDPNGLSTRYEIMATTPNCPLPRGTCASISVWFPHGEIGAATGVQCIGLELPKIGVPILPEHPYRYRIWARNSVGTAEAGGGFTTPAEGAPPEHEENICPVSENGGPVGDGSSPISQPIAPVSLLHHKMHIHKRHKRHKRHRHTRGESSVRKISTPHAASH